MARGTEKVMVNGRVDAVDAKNASRTLKRGGLTVSEFIRNSMEYVSRTGRIPESGRKPPERSDTLGHLRRVLGEIEAADMPGKGDFAGLSEDEGLERMRMERYGY